MEDNNTFNRNLEKLISLHGQEQKMDEEQKKKILENLTNDKKQAHIPVATQSHVWHKIAIAAMLVFVPTVLAIYFLIPSGQKIEIPPELASMSLEELVALNYDSSQNTFDPNIVKYALKQALEKAAPEKVIQIAKSLDDGGMDGHASIMAPPAHPIEHLGYASKTFQEVMEQSNIFVHANLIDVHINVDDIIAALVDKEMYKNFEHYVSRYRVSIELHVVDCLPENVLKKGKKITVQTTLFEDKLNLLKKNTGYYFCMTQDKNNKLHFLEYFSGVYTVDYNKPANIEMWQFVKEAQDILLYGQTPKYETIEYWSTKLQGDTYLLALEYMNILPDDLLPVESVIAALEQGYSDYILFALTSEEKIADNDDEEERRKISNEAYNVKHNTMDLFEKTILLLLRSGDKNCIKRMLALIDEDSSSIDKSVVVGQNNFNRGFMSLIIRMTIISNEGDLGERLIETYNKYKDRPFTDIDNSGNEYLASLRRNLRTFFEHSFTTEIIYQLKNMPLKYTQSFFLRAIEDPSVLEIFNTSSLKMVWESLIASEDFDMRSYLEKFITNPDLSDIGIELQPDTINNIPSSLSSSLYDYEQAAYEVLCSIPGINAIDDEELLNYLLMIYERNKDNQQCINFTIDKLGEILQLSNSECSSILDKINVTDKLHWSIADMMSIYTPDTIAVPKNEAVRINNNESGIKAIEALYDSGQEDEAVMKAIEIFNEPFREDTSRNLLNDLRRKVDLVLFLGKTQKPEFESQIDQYTREENIGKYRNYSADLEGRVIGYTVEILLHNSIMALARIGEKSSVSRLREIYNTTDNIRAKIIAAIGLYYNGDNTGEGLIRHFVEGTHHDVPEIEMRWGIDITDGKVFQNVIDSYLRNKLTDALWLEKMSHYLDRADTNIDNDFFKEHKKEILNIVVGQLNNKNKDIRVYAIEILQKATGQNFGFDSGRYAGQQEDIIEQWKEYLNSIEKQGQ